MEKGDSATDKGAPGAEKGGFVVDKGASDTVEGDSALDKGAPYEEEPGGRLCCRYLRAPLTHRKATLP